MSFETILVSVKYIVTIPIFLFWSLYDLLTKTVVVKWQRSLIGFGIVYNLMYLFVDTTIVNDNITGFIVCYLIAKVYAYGKRILTGGMLGAGDVIYYAIVGLMFGTAVGILTIVLSFVIFDLLLKFSLKIFRTSNAIEVAFFPFITCALLIVVIFIGETNVRNYYDHIFDLLKIDSRFIKIF